MEGISYHLIQIFQDFDSMCINLQSRLDDLKDDDIFLPTRREKRLLLILEHFCDFTLTSIQDFLNFFEIDRNAELLRSNTQN